MSVGMRRPGVRRRGDVLVFVLLSVLVVGFVTYQLLDSPTYIYYYRVLDERTLMVDTVTGPGAQVRVTAVAETPSTVTITVRSLYIRLGAGTSVGHDFQSVAKLREPLADRTVIDASDGHRVARVDCSRPDVFAPVCP